MAAAAGVCQALARHCPRWRVSIADTNSAPMRLRVTQPICAARSSDRRTCKLLWCEQRVGKRRAGRSKCGVNTSLDAAWTLAWARVLGLGEHEHNFTSSLYVFSELRPSSASRQTAVLGKTAFPKQALCAVRPTSVHVPHASRSSIHLVLSQGLGCIGLCAQHKLHLGLSPCYETPVLPIDVLFMYAPSFF